MNRQEAENIKGELMNFFQFGIKYSNSKVSEMVTFQESFDKLYPPEPEYIPFEYTDFKDFMLKKVCRKVGAFKDELWLIVDRTEKTAVLYSDGELLYKSYSSMFEEWEFSDGTPFGKLKK